MDQRIAFASTGGGPGLGVGGCFVKCHPFLDVSSGGRHFQVDVAALIQYFFVEHLLCWRDFFFPQEFFGVSSSKVGENFTSWLGKLPFFFPHEKHFQTLRMFETNFAPFFSLSFFFKSPKKTPHNKKKVARCRGLSCTGAVFKEMCVWAKTQGFFRLGGEELNS